MAQPQQKKVSPDLVVAIVDAFLDWTHKHRAVDTYEWYRYRLQRFVSRYPDLRVIDLRPFHVQEWVDTYDFAKTSRRNYVRSVKRCFNWALRQGYIDNNPLAYLEAPGSDRRETVVTQAEFEEMLSFVEDRALRDLFLVTWETGCRPQESLRVEARHFDTDNQRWIFPIAESKTNRQPRVVYLTEVALEITQRRSLAYPEGPLFRNGRGVPWTTEAVNCAVDRIRQRMGKRRMDEQAIEIPPSEIEQFIKTLNPSKTRKGITTPKTRAELRCEAKRKLKNRRARDFVPRYSLYALRHSWATNALQRGVDSLTVAILMGHSDPSMLARVYQHLSHNPQHLLEQAKKAAG